MREMRFTQAQVRELLGLKPETMRHWRKCLGPLASRPRKAAYDHADLLAVAIVRKLVREAGLAVSDVAPAADHLFQACCSQSWPHLARCRLRLEGGVASLEPSDAPSALGACCLVLVPLAPVIVELRQALLGQEAAQQAELRFPLTAQPGLRA